MITEVTLESPELVTAIHALGREAYAVEANLIGCANFPPLRESIEQLRASRNRFLVYCDSNKIVAVLSFSCETNCLAINRLCVSPKYFRRGIARALLTRLEEFGKSSIVVATAQSNIPAVELYRRHGYTLTGTSHSPEGIALAHFKKTSLSV